MLTLFPAVFDSRISMLNGGGGRRLCCCSYVMVSYASRLQVQDAKTNIFKSHLFSLHPYCLCPLITLTTFNPDLIMPHVAIKIPGGTGKLFRLLASKFHFEASKSPINRVRRCFAARRGGPVLIKAQNGNQAFPAIK